MPFPTRPSEIIEIDRDEFIAQRFAYKAGECVTTVGRFGSGKTMLNYQLLDKVASPELPALSFVMKPRDVTALQFTRDAGFEITKTWPPRRNPLRPKPRGWTVWPPHTFNTREDNYRMYDVFSRALLGSYEAGNRIILADEVVGLAKLSDGRRNGDRLEDDLEAVWMRGRAMGVGIWASSQRPAYVPPLAYQATHLFLSYEPDKVTRRRFGEISGINNLLVEDTVAALKKFYWLYINRNGPYVAIIRP